MLRWCVPGLVLLLSLAGCSEDKIDGPIRMLLIQPNGAHCGYSIAPGTVNTLLSLSAMRGTLGQVVWTGENLGARPEILDQGDGFSPIDVQFARSGDVYAPLDYPSLFAASLYNAVETGYNVVKRADPSFDLQAIVPNLSDTRIVYNARRTFGELGVDPEVDDNAEFLAHRVSLPSGGELVQNYLFSFPTKEVSTLPLGLNLGIMVHEFTHLIFHHLFYEKAFARDVQTSDDRTPVNSLRAIDEGNADYFGFVASQDAGFFGCSFPNSDRDLSVEKWLNSSHQAALASEDYDPHDGGAIWAAIQYQIGQSIGHDNNIRALLRFMSQLINCSTSGSVLNLSFSQAAQCHAQAAGSNSGAVMQVYGRYLGGGN